MSDSRYLQDMTFSSQPPKSQTPLGTSNWPSKTTLGHKYKVCYCLFTTQPWSKHNELTETVAVCHGLQHMDPERVYNKNVPIFVQYSAFFELFYGFFVYPWEYKVKMLTPVSLRLTHHLRESRLPGSVLMMTMSTTTNSKSSCPLYEEKVIQESKASLWSAPIIIIDIENPLKLS